MKIVTDRGPYLWTISYLLSDVVQLFYQASIKKDIDKVILFIIELYNVNISTNTLYSMWLYKL